MIEFSFGKASSFQPATLLKINFHASILVAFENAFFQEQLSFAASISPLKNILQSAREDI